MLCFVTVCITLLNCSNRIRCTSVRLLTQLQQTECVDPESELSKCKFVSKCNIYADIMFYITLLTRQNSPLWEARSSSVRQIYKTEFRPHSHTKICSNTGTVLELKNNEYIFTLLIHTCMHTYTHTYLHACMHTYIHKYIHTYMYQQSKNVYVFWFSNLRISSTVFRIHLKTDTKSTTTFCMYLPVCRVLFQVSSRSAGLHI
jgi:hypothetical protein